MAPATLVREALLTALRQPAGRDKPSRRLQAIADKLVALALRGDLYAIREVFERIADPRAQTRPAWPRKPSR